MRFAIVVSVGSVCVTALGVCAIIQGVNGVALASVIGAVTGMIGSYLGYEFGRKK